MFVEMSRTDDHGGGTWAFPNCLWSPTYKRPRTGSARRDRWPYWEKLLSVQLGDVVFHLRGRQPNARFVGYSLAASNGFETSKRPPNPGQWGYSDSFYRVDLTEFVAFHEPISLQQLFVEHRQELETYFLANRARETSRNLFFVRQSGRLQCQNGAYLSDLDDDLFALLFDAQPKHNSDHQRISAQTRDQLRLAKARIGQKAFSDQIKKMYGNQCSITGCEIDDPRFLVGSHIARWADNPELRGNPGNGLCLCTFHDKAFELGLFTLDEKRRVFINPKEMANPTAATRLMLRFACASIRPSSNPPLDDSILEHWIRVDVSP